MSKKAILAVSFGTTFSTTREQTIGATEKALAQAFPNYDVFRAFTSKIVRTRIRERENLVIDSPTVALKQLLTAGYEEVYVQSLHIIPGIEYGMLQDVVQSYQKKFHQLKITQPLLETFEDFQRLTGFLSKQSKNLANDEAILWMGHGTVHSSFTTYACLDHLLVNSKSYVGAVESYPTIEDEIVRLKQAQIKKVFIKPLMLVAGNHAHNDMASDAPRSWKSILKRNQISAQPILRGLGEYPEIQAMFISKLKEAMKGGEENR